MQCKPFKHGLVLAQNAPDFERSPGLHMSDIYNALYKKLDPRRYDKRDEDGNPEELNRAKLEAGMGLELRLEPNIASVFGGSRPGELFTQHARTCPAYRTPVRDGAVLCACGAGVAYSPDWLFDIAGRLILGEFKFSWYSCRDFPRDRKFSKWLCQCKAYCYHLRVTDTWMFPFWVNGVYPTGAPTPLFEDAYALTFTQRELDDNWSDLLRFAKKEKMMP